MEEQAHKLTDAKLAELVFMHDGPPAHMAREEIACSAALFWQHTSCLAKVFGRAGNIAAHFCSSHYCDTTLERNIKIGEPILQAGNNESGFCLSRNAPWRWR
jgi:hypothetical protein